MRKKTLSWLLAVSMVLSMFVSVPLNASAVALPGAIFTDGDLDRVYFSGDTLSFNLANLPVGTPPTGIPAGTTLRVSLGIVDASSTFTDYTLFNTSFLTSEDPNYVFNGMGDNTGWYLSRTLNADGTLSSTISGTIVTTPPPTLGVAAVKIYVNNGLVWQNFMDDGNPATPDFIPLTAEGKDAIVGLDGILEMPDGVTSDPVIGTLAQTAEDLRSLDISFTKTIAMDTTGTIAFTGLNLLDNSSGLAGLEDGLIMNQVSIPTAGAIAQYTLGVDVGTLTFLNATGATISVTSASFDRYETSDFEAVAADVTGGLVSGLAFDDATDTVSFIVNHFSNYTLSVLENESELYDAVINVVDGTGTGVGWTYASGEVWINENGSYLINGGGIQTSNRIQVKAGVTAVVTLDDVNINVNLPFNCNNNSNVTLVLADNTTNTLNGYGGHAGLRVVPTATLTITTAGQSVGNGSLSAYGGADSSSSWASAGIGGSELESSGTIIINGGTIFAKGGDGRTPGAWRGPGAAGIGGAQGRACGDITINGGTVTAVGGDVNPEGAGIGGGSSDPSTYAGKIKINGGTVRAYSGQSGPSGTGIGFCSTIAIADTADVKAYSSGNYPAIHGTTDTSGHNSFLLNLMLDAIVLQDTDVTITQIDDGTELFEMTLLANYKNFAATVKTANNYYAGLSDGSKKIVSIADETTDFPGICDLPGAALSSISVKLKANPVCMIGSTEYETLGGALAAVTEGQTIKLLKDISYSERIWAGSSYRPSLTLDLNGYELNISNVEVPIAAIDGYDIVVTDSSESGGGTLVLITTSGDSAPTGVTAVGTGSSVLVDSSVTTTITATSDNSKGVSAYYGGSVDIGSGSITSDTYGIYTYGMSGESASVVTFTGDVSALSDYGIGVYAENGGTAMVTGDITGPNIGQGVIAYSGTISITGDVTSLGNAATAYGSGIVTITGNATATGEYGCGAYAYEGGTVNIGGDVTASASNGYGAWAQNGGSVTVGGNVSETGNGGVGAYADGFSYGGEITIAGTIEAENYICIGDRYMEPDEADEPTTKAGYLTYDYGDPVSTVWVRNHLLAVEDTWIGEYYQDWVCGAWPTIEIGTTVTDETRSYALLRFDVSSLPSSAGSVKLQLRFSGITSSGCHLSEVTAHRVTSAWDEETVSYSTRPTWDSAVIDTFDGTIFGNGYIGDVWEWDITELYNEWKANPSSNFGVLLSAPTALVDLQAQQGFYSKEGALDDAYAPKLIIEESTCIVPGCTDPNADGALTESEMIEGVEYYHISSAAQLAHINEHLDLNYIQTADIDLSAYNRGLWTPIGGFGDPDDYSNPGYFTGKYIGNGYKIENLNVFFNDTDQNAAYAGVFAEIYGKDASVSDLTVTVAGVDITAYNYTYFGAVAGAVYGGSVTNCHAVYLGDVDAAYTEGEIRHGTPNGYIGGITGNANQQWDSVTGSYFPAAIDGCSVTFSTGSILADGWSKWAGGIAGRGETPIINCSVIIGEDQIIRSPNAGGIVGIMYAKTSGTAIGNCTVTGEGSIVASPQYSYSYYIGGIAGRFSEGGITDSSNEVFVNANGVTEINIGEKVYAGGLVGYLGSRSTITGCKNMGDVSIIIANNILDDYGAPGTTAYNEFAFAGGVAGYVYGYSNAVTIENCENDANISSVNLISGLRAYAGGIAGHVDSGDGTNAGVIVKNCANLGADKTIYTSAGTTMTGGLFGSTSFHDFETPNIVLQNSYNRSSVLSESNSAPAKNGMCVGITAGGIIGASGEITVANTYSTAPSVSAFSTNGADAYEGGIFGVLYMTTASRNYYEENSEIVRAVGAAGELLEAPDDLSGSYEGASASELKTKSFFTGWPWYSSGGTAPDYYNSANPWRMTAANTYPLLKGLPYDAPTPPGGGSYTPSTYLIAATANEGGTITPTGNTAVTENSSITFTIKPDTNYVVKDVQIDGTSVGSVTTYTFSAVRANHTIKAIFAHVCPSKPFTDVDITQWYHEGIDYVLLAGLLKGTSATTFEPNTAMTRAMLVTVLHRLEGTPEATTGNPFTDVVSKNWYTNAVIWASAKGIVKGYDSDTFGTNDSITREQLATILYRYAQYKGYDVSVGEDTNILSYKDALNISEYAIPAVQWACGAGIMQGDGAKLDPQGNATRAQVAVMLMRFIENVAK